MFDQTCLVGSLGGAIGSNMFDKHVYPTIFNSFVFTPEPHQTSFIKHVWPNMFDQTIFKTCSHRNLFDQTCLIKHVWSNKVYQTIWNLFTPDQTKNVWSNMFVKHVWSNILILFVCEHALRSDNGGRENYYHRTGSRTEKVGKWVCELWI